MKLTIITDDYETTAVLEVEETATVRNVGTTENFCLEI